MVKKILIVLVVALLVFLTIVAMQPEDFRISRSGTVAVAPSVVFPHVNDFHLWEHWSPWAKLDPAMTTKFDGPVSGERAAYSWAGNSQVGEGKMTIVKSQPFETILVKLEFVKPMSATNMAEFSFQPEGSGTRVTWTMSGKNNFMGKAIHLVLDMEKMVGPSFEQGLAQLKAVAEATPQ